MSAKDYQHRTPCTERIPGTLELCNVLVPIHWRGSTPIRQEHDCRAVNRDDPQRDGPNNDWPYRQRCPICGESFTEEECPMGHEPQVEPEEGKQPYEEIGQLPEPPTVKRATLFDGVIDSFRTETELNGFKARQGALL